jgi:Ran GTPase-activating protein (RanGAP) involved in mRNA processing and transport
MVVDVFCFVFVSVFRTCFMMNVFVHRVVVEGLETNGHLQTLELNLSGNAIGPSGAQILENYIANIHGITSLDISDNG